MLFHVTSRRYMHQNQILMSADRSFGHEYGIYHALQDAITELG